MDKQSLLKLDQGNDQHFYGKILDKTLKKLSYFIDFPRKITFDESYKDHL